MAENRVASAGDIIYFRKSNQKSKVRIYIRKPSTIYTATLSAVPSTHDMVIQISFTGGVGTLSNVKVNMALLIGSTAGGHDIGFARIRKTPIAGTFYIGETSEVNWSYGGTIYLTVVDDAIGIWPKHLKLVSGTPYIDADIAYTNQHTNFDPVVIMGTDRVVKLTGASVAVAFDAGDSWVYGSTITGYSWSAPGSSASSGMTTATPSIEYNAEGEYQVYCTITAATGKTHTGVRTVFVDAGTLGYEGTITSNPTVSISEGGWSTEITVVGDLSDLMDFTKVVIATEDYYDNTNVEIGPISGSENIELIGWIVEETLEISPSRQFTKFRVATAHFMLANISGFIHGIEQSISASSAWTNMYGLTVDKSLWHMFHWRTTVDSHVDIVLTGDTRYIKETTTPAGNLWQQFVQMLSTTILANIACDRYSRVIAQIEPQLVPVASRTWDTVRTLEEQDWYGEINLKPETLPKTGRVYLDGISISVGGQGQALFSLSPGHVPKRFGSFDPFESLLLTNQTQANTLAGAILAWRNNRYKDIPVDLIANDRYIDIMPNMYLAATFSDVRRNRTITGDFIPRRIERVWDRNNGSFTTSVSVELATVPDIFTDGDIPDGGGDIPQTPYRPPKLPPLPPIAIPPIPGEDGDTNGPRYVMFISSNLGVLYSTNFNETSPSWQYMNLGLESLSGDYSLVTRVAVAPSGTIFMLVKDAATGFRGSDYVYYAEGLGDPWKLLFTTPSGHKIVALGVNPAATEQIAVMTGHTVDDSGRLYLGSSLGLSLAGSGLDSSLNDGDISYGSGKWFATHAERNLFNSPAWSRWSGSGSIEVNTTNWTRVNDRRYCHRRGGNYIYEWNDSDSPFRATGNDGATATTIAVGAQVFNSDGYPCALAVSPTGQNLMGGSNSGVIGHRSSDYGATMVACDASLGVGYVTWENCASENFFLAATTQVVKMTPDWGTTWIDKSGNLASVAPLSAALHLVFIGW